MNSYFSMYRESLQNFLSVWQYDSTRWWLPCMLTAFSFKVYKLSVFIKELEIRQSVNIAYCKKLFSKKRSNQSAAVPQKWKSVFKVAQAVSTHDLRITAKERRLEILPVVSSPTCSTHNCELTVWVRWRFALVKACRRQDAWHSLTHFEITAHIYFSHRGTSDITQTLH